MTVIIFYVDKLVGAHKCNEFFLEPKGFFVDQNYKELSDVSKILVDGVVVWEANP